MGGIAITPLEGKSLVAAFANGPLDRDLFWEHEGNRAVRTGNWKLVAKGPGANGSSTTSLPTEPSNMTSRTIIPIA